jgi:transposase
MDGAIRELRRKWQFIMPRLNEKQRRLLAAAEAAVLGYGGISLVARASGLSRATIYKGMRELGEADLPGRIRRPGGGRKPTELRDPTILKALERLIDPTTRGDPQSPLQWTCKSCRHLAEALQKQGHAVSPPTVGRLLQHLGYSLQANAKILEGKQHPDRDAQFQYINRRTKSFLRRKMPVISVDSKKKELVGNYAGRGREWEPQGQPVQTQSHDFPDRNRTTGRKAISYGVYDIGRNKGWVSVGRDHDTAAFAVETIRRWWTTMGKKAYPDAPELLVRADAGGSNGYRIRLWKVELQRLADETGLRITVCHFPPGTSKWNKIDHRLFCYITLNWRGRPLVSHEVIVNLIARTTTRTGLEVRARLDRGEYPLKVKVSASELRQVRLTRHRFHGEWNYTIAPRQ